MKKIVKGKVFYSDLDLYRFGNRKGLTPIVVIQNDMEDKFIPTVIVAPISTKSYNGRTLSTHVEIEQFKKIRPNSIIMLEQIMTIDKNRLRGYVCILQEKEIEAVDRAILIALGIK